MPTPEEFAASLARRDPNAAFEVHQRDGKIFRIYASGKTEGFSEGSVIFNRIPERVYRAVRATVSPGEKAVLLSASLEAEDNASA